MSVSNKNGNIIIGLGSKGLVLLERINNELLGQGEFNSQNTKLVGLDVLWSSNHYQHTRPKFLAPDKFIFLDYYKIRSNQQLRRIPQIGTWFSESAQDYFLRYMLHADDYGQGPAVPMKRFLGRLAFIVDFLKIESRLMHLLGTCPFENKFIYIVSSIASPEGSGILMDLTFLIRKLTKGDKNIRISAILTLEKDLQKSYLPPSILRDFALNKYLFLQELEFFNKPEGFYEAEFLYGNNLKDFQNPFDVVFCYDSFENEFELFHPFRSESIKFTNDIYYNKNLVDLQEIIKKFSVVNFSESGVNENIDNYSEEQISSLFIFPNRNIYSKWDPIYIQEAYLENRKWWSLGLADPFNLIFKSGAWYYLISKKYGKRTYDYKIKLAQGRFEALKELLENEDYIQEIRENIVKIGEEFNNQQVIQILKKYGDNLLEKVKKQTDKDIRNLVELEINDIENYIEQIM